MAALNPSFRIFVCVDNKWSFADWDFNYVNARNKCAKFEGKGLKTMIVNGDYTDWDYCSRSDTAKKVYRYKKFGLGI
jgi:hypothetical protein